VTSSVKPFSVNSSFMGTTISAGYILIIYLKIKRKVKENNFASGHCGNTVRRILLLLKK
jgi:hypothetical protein